MTKEQPAGIGDRAVENATGKTWEQWLLLIDRAGGRKKTHKEIVAYLESEHGIGPWWQQMVTVGYEQARKKREKNEAAKGFQVSISKTIAAPLEKLFEAWSDAKRRKLWLAHPDYTLRTAIANRSLRFHWIDRMTRVEVMFIAKGKEKSQVSVRHSRLRNGAEAAKQKEYWSDQLTRLKQLLERT